MRNGFVLVLALTASKAIGEAKSNRLSYFETDFHEPEAGLQRNAIKLDQYKWPNGTVPYVFADDYSESDRAAVVSGMEVFHNETCVKFVPKSEADVEHIRFVKGNGCGANVGYRRKRKDPLDVSYSKFCLKIRGAIQHEMFHVLGLLHEQSRPDRDEHVKILWDNIDPSELGIDESL